MHFADNFKDTSLIYFHSDLDIYFICLTGVNDVGVWILNSKFEN